MLVGSASVDTITLILTILNVGKCGQTEWDFDKVRLNCKGCSHLNFEVNSETVTKIF